jgi:hypothetical protein
LVLVEDCTTAGETIDWLRWLLESDEAPPMLAVLAAPSQFELPSLQPLLGHPAVEVIAIDPLDDADMRELVDALIGLEAPLAERVVHQARGFAGYAVQLVSDWVDRGALVPGPEGFTVIPSEAADLPADVPANIGYAAAEKHFSTARLNPDIMTVETDHDMRNPTDMIVLDRVAVGVDHLAGHLVVGVQTDQVEAEDRGLVARDLAEAQADNVEQARLADAQLLEFLDAGLVEDLVIGLDAGGVLELLEEGLLAVLLDVPGGERHAHHLEFRRVLRCRIARSQSHKDGGD